LILPKPAILVITDRRQARVPLETIAAGLFAGGCRWLSLREKDMPSAERRDLLRRLKKLGDAHGASVIIHDDLAAAADTGAAGIHLPAGASVREARRVLGIEVLIGQSAHNQDDVRRAAGEGAGYVTLSPIFLTDSKPGYGPALGLDALRVPSPSPVLALGGVGISNAADCIAAGAAGIAVMGEAMRALDPQAFMVGLRHRLAAAG
jgi:thiamine-phosphate pyrophosphorylase